LKRWILGQGIEDNRWIFCTIPSNVRYNSCIVIDEAALRAIASLPNHLPKVSDEFSETLRKVADYQRIVWVWVLCAMIIKDHRDGVNDTKPYRGWMEVRIHQLFGYWFMRMIWDRDFVCPMKRINMKRGCTGMTSKEVCGVDMQALKSKIKIKSCLSLYVNVLAAYEIKVI
jgi:hypothetical protein